MSQGMDMGEHAAHEGAEEEMMFGKLTLDAVPYHEPIIMVTVAAIIVGGLAVLALITYFGKWN